ncbi:NAD(P)-binding protein [Burkholderiaceae bacterium DAT-1]|nr:NAD(P)-binding protein [Burkholderiaceae bacterium DAT-1]
MDRRTLLKRAALLAGLPVLQSCERVLSWGLPVRVNRPGMAAGHQLRNGMQPPAPIQTHRCDVAIIGSGAAGLFAGWRLAKSGLTDVVILNGPEPDGNAAGGAFGDYRYPTGAHYLPLPSAESTHVRELLADMGVIEGDPFTTRPVYDERVLVHAPDERLWVDGQWQSGLMPHLGQDATALAEQARFLAEVAHLRSKRGSDGRKVFCIPLALSSTDPAYTRLDQMSFAVWLDTRGYRSAGLRWYLDYCCRDDYGSDLAHTSAWAGLHYFCSRHGQAANAEDGAVLTWPDGLSPLIRHMRSRIGTARQWPGMAWRVQDSAQGVSVDFLDDRGQSQRLIARKVILAVPLHVALHLYPQMADIGFTRDHLPPRAPWLVGNFLIDQFPYEPIDMPLAWDNVVYGSHSLGYVVSTHQMILQGKPPMSVFTAYHAFADADPLATRRWLEHAPDDALFDVISDDLHTVYGWRFRQNLTKAELTVRAHAMASPSPGFLANTGLHALRNHDGAVLFAHSDLSGLSLFEEASWWGEQAAQRILQSSHVA